MASLVEKEMILTVLKGSNTVQTYIHGLITFKEIGRKNLDYQFVTILVETRKCSLLNNQAFSSIMIISQNCNYFKTIVVLQWKKWKKKKKEYN